MEDKAPDKGQFNGECNRTACTNAPAIYYNTPMQAYYCEHCAMLIGKEFKETFPNQENPPKMLLDTRAVDTFTQGGIEVWDAAAKKAIRYEREADPGTVGFGRDVIDKTPAFKKFMTLYKQDAFGDHKSLRVGQAFHNAYIKRGNILSFNTYLFHQEDDEKASVTIIEWLNDCHYFYELPPRVR